MRIVAHVLTGLRIIAAPFLWLSIIGDRLDIAFAILVLAAASDVMDGRMVRRFGKPSVLGGYYDATADFVVLFTAFLAFAAIGAFPTWLPALVALAFVLFLMTSRAGPTIYDPVGRYIGAILYVAAIATAFAPLAWMQAAIQWTTLTSLAFTMVARLFYAAVALMRVVRHA
jgi:phosphatidylglycerophosphate synthase